MGFYAVCYAKVVVQCLYGFREVLGVRRGYAVCVWRDGVRRVFWGVTPFRISHW